MATIIPEVIDVTETFSPKKKTRSPVRTPAKKLAIQQRLENSPRKVTTPEQIQERLERAVQRKQAADDVRLAHAKADLSKALRMAEQARNSPKKTPADKENAVDTELHAELLAVSEKHQRSFE